MQKPTLTIGEFVGDNTESRDIFVYKLKFNDRSNTMNEHETICESESNRN